MDFGGTDKATILSELKQRLTEKCTDFTHAETDTFYETAALCQEAWMEEYLETGSISLNHLQKGIAAEALVPVFFGSALKLQGTEMFFHQLNRYTMEKSYPSFFGASVFKIATDEKNNRLTYLKITGGTLHVRDSITYTDNSGNTHSEKISQVRVYSGAKFTTPECIYPGMVCAVTGPSHTYAGQGLGFQPDKTDALLEPIMRYRIRLPEGCQPTDVWEQLTQLEEEDPTLHFQWDTQHQQIQVQVMGEVQLEILEKLIADRFGLMVQFHMGQIAYCETIVAPAECVGHYEPLRHYAEVHLLLEPLPSGSGLQFASTCREDDLDQNWQRLILTHLSKKTHLGVLTGSPITDMRITLCAGRAHIKHTEGGDFRQATYRAVRNGLRKAESVLLEP